MTGAGVLSVGMLVVTIEQFGLVDVGQIGLIISGTGGVFDVRFFDGIGARWARDYKVALLVGPLSQEQTDEFSQRSGDIDTSQPMRKDNRLNWR